jgi:hypothetical protein
MTNDAEAILDDILRSWHRWAAAHPHVAGYPHECVSCLPYRTSRQYDDANGAMEMALHDSHMAAVDAVIGRVAQPWRTALAINARNLATGVVVWSSARLPDDVAARALVVAKARSMLTDGLAQAGML